jgi:hypothetical protein
MHGEPEVKSPDEVHDGQSQPRAVIYRIHHFLQQVTDGHRYISCVLPSKQLRLVSEVLAFLPIVSVLR